MPNYSVLWDETTPPGSEVKSLGDNRIREFKAQLRERLNTEHDNITGTAGDALLLHKWLITSKSTGSPYTTLVTDHVLLITTGASAYTINLPTAVGISGKLYTIKKVDAGVGTVIIDPSAAQTIDGGATFVLSHQYDFVDIVSDGANWLILSTNTNFDWDNIWTDPVHTHLSDAEGGVLAYSALKFLATPVNKVNWTVATDWTDVDISADTGTDTAKAALVQLTVDIYRAQSGAGGSYAGALATLRKNGSAVTSNLARQRTLVPYITTTIDQRAANGGLFTVECDGAEIFEVKLESIGAIIWSTIGFTVDLIGYFI